MAIILRNGRMYVLTREDEKDITEKFFGEIKWEHGRAWRGRFRPVPLSNFFSGLLTRDWSPLCLNVLFGSRSRR